MPFPFTPCPGPPLLSSKLGHRPDPVSPGASRALGALDEARAGVRGDSQAPPRGPAALLCSSLDRSDFGLGHDSCDSSPGGERTKGPLWSPRWPEAGASWGSTAPRWPRRSGVLAQLRPCWPCDPVRPVIRSRSAPVQREGCVMGEASTKGGIVRPAPRGEGKLGLQELLPGEPFHRAGRGPRPFSSESLA